MKTAKLSKKPVEIIQTTCLNYKPIHGFSLSIYDKKLGTIFRCNNFKSQSNRKTDLISRRDCKFCINCKKEKMSTKVKNTERHVAQGKETSVVKGILRLIPVESHDNLNDSCVRKTSSGSAEYNRICNKDTDLKPIIISETERIEPLDLYFDSFRNKIMKASIAHVSRETEFKILVTPKQFSLFHIRAIASGKFQDGDDTLVECVGVGEWFGAKFIVAHSEVKVNRDQEVTLYKVEKKTFTEKEIQSVLNNLITGQDTHVQVTTIEREFDKLFNSKS